MTERFTNLHGDAHVSKAGDVLRWKLGLHPEVQKHTKKTGIAVPCVYNDGRALRKGLDDGLTWIGHASFLVQLHGRSLLIDPVFSNSLGPGFPRNVAPGLRLQDMPKIDVVLLTHNHRDHMDEPSIRQLGREPLFVVPKGLGRWFLQRGFKRVREMVWWEELDVFGIKITFVPSQHWSRRGVMDTNQSWWGGYVLEKDGLRFYHSGDTAWFDGFKQIGETVGELQAAMLPIGAYAPRWFMKHQHMNPEDAVAAFRALGAVDFVAMHWGTFKLTDEPLDEPPILLHKAWETNGLSSNRRRVPAIGETLVYR